MSDTAVRLPDANPMLRMMPMPADANIHGDVFGGWIMANVDVAGAFPAARRANGRVTTVAVTSFLFRNPVFVGGTGVVAPLVERVDVGLDDRDVGVRAP